MLGLLSLRWGRGSGTLTDQIVLFLFAAQTAARYNSANMQTIEPMRQISKFFVLGLRQKIRYYCIFSTDVVKCSKTMR